jgi:two-component system, NarL family, invasion response regulator UvrY
MLKILVADKYNIHRIGLVQILVEAFPGARIEEANDLDSLFNKSSAGKWDIIISGFILPIEKGIDIIQKIRTTDPGISLVACGMQLQKDDITRLLNAGASVFIDKGAKAPLIVELVKKALLLAK